MHSTKRIIDLEIEIAQLHKFLGSAQEGLFRLERELQTTRNSLDLNSRIVKQIIATTVDDPDAFWDGTYVNHRRKHKFLTDLLANGLFFFASHISPTIDNTSDVGTTSIALRKLFTRALRLVGFTNTRPVKIDGSGDIVTARIDLSDSTNDITGTLAIANGGTGSTTASGARSNLGAAAITGLTPGTVTLFKITGGGTDGSLTMSSDGTITAYTAPT